MSECYYAGWKELPPCEPPGTWHHIVPQQRIKRRYAHGAVLLPGEGWRPVRRSELWSTSWGRQELAATGGQFRSLKRLLDDPRNGLWICWGHHQLVEGKRIYPEIPETTWEFAEDFGFTAGLLGDHSRRT